MTAPLWGLPKPPPGREPVAAPAANEVTAGGQVANSEFMAALLRSAAPGTAGWVHAFDGNPDGSKNWGGWSYNPAIQAEAVDRWGAKNTYFSVAALRTVDGDLSRRKVNFDRLLALVADDVEAGDLVAAPTYILQTSPGKRQVGFMLYGDDPDAADLALVTRLVTAMADKGLLKADKSGNNAVRYVRLPVGTNQKPRDTGPWQHRLETWEPDSRFTLDEAAHCLGIDLDELRAEARSQPQQATGLVEGSQDEKLKVLAAHIMQGTNLHDSTTQMVASLVATGMHPGGVTNLMRGMMESSLAARDERWQARYDDIPRAVMTAVEKFRPAAQAAQGQPETPAEPVAPMFDRVTNAMLSQIRSPRWLIKGIVEQDALAMVFGPSGVGKSFVAIDWACCIATGLPWLGHACEKAPVFYVAGEGAAGLEKRMTGWQKSRSADVDGAHLYRSRHSVQLLDPAEAQRLAAEIAANVDQGMPPPGVVVVDTFARNFGDGDENSAADVGRFIENIDTLIRKRWKCTVIIVHHSGHLVGRARGSSAIKAAMDQEISLAPVPGGNFILAVTKMKDAEPPPPKELKLKSVVIGEDPVTEEEVDTAVVAVVGDALAFKVARRPDGSDLMARDVVDLLRAGWTSFTQVTVDLQVGKKTAQRVIKDLVLQQILVKVGDGNNCQYHVHPDALAALSRIGGLLSPEPPEDD